MLPYDLKDDTEIVAVSVDDREKQQMMIDRVIEEDGIVPDFIMLTDTDHRVIDRYGLFNPDEPRSRPVPHPTTFVIDRGGTIRSRTLGSPPNKFESIQAAVDEALAASS